MTATDTTSRCLVIGAGVGGLATAALVSQKKRAVEVFEKNEFIGGKVSRMNHSSQLIFDRGPSIIVLKEIYEHLFELLQRPLSSYLNFQRLDPGFVVRNAQGEAFSIRAELSDTLASVRNLDARSAQELEIFLKKCGRLAQNLGLGYASRPYTKFWHLFYPDLVKSAWVVSPFKSYGAFIEQSFRHPLLRQFFLGFPSYAGLHPHKAPASMALLPWSLICQGVFYPSGGIFRIAQSLHEICLENGVEFHLEQRWVGSQFSKKGLQELVFHSREHVATSVKVGAQDHVVFNGDVSMLSEIIPGGFPAQWMHQSPSFFSLMFGLPKEFVSHNDLGHHNLFLPIHAPRCYHDFYEPGAPYPQHPPVYLNIPSVTDAAVAPPHLCNCFVVVSVPSYLNPEAAQAQTQTYAQHVWDTLKSYVHLPPLPRETTQQGSGVPLETVVQDPLFFAQTYLQRGGQIYGPDPNKTGVLMKLFRIPHRIRDNIFAVGGSVQPGAGLPMVIQSAKIVSRLVCS